jgi:hypothetical protein
VLLFIKEGTSSLSTPTLGLTPVCPLLSHGASSLQQQFYEWHSAQTLLLQASVCVGDRCGGWESPKFLDSEE